MTDYLPGGRRRVDRVLAPDFVTGLDGLDLDQIRARRIEADQEETDLSYARRLLQGRIDILRAEQAARRGDGPMSGHPRTDEEIVKALSLVLADERRQDHGMGRHTVSEPSRIGEHRREAERAVADVGASATDDLSDEALAAAVAKLVDVEARVSRVRREVQGVVDALTAEIARRYAAGGVPVGAGS
ncbi:aerial mycelium formation protein [Kineosporia sp. A_224]|uniref:RsiG family protein n=1 Tax=Kineosporia sp. A_224 TaxID=1962180 RepID=UPI000B4ADF0A|nr:aerial mycelium formation protein [Kineosporia sp. A_224]